MVSAKEKGQVSHHSSLRACATCLEQNEKCVKRAIFAATADCETGNKGAFEMIRKSIEEGNMDPEISLFTVLPDSVHVGKSLKASFSNWWLKLNNERSNIGLLRTLRNRSTFDTMSKVRKLIPRNDHVKNKDRQDPSAVLTLCSDRLTSFLSSVGYVCHTLIPELDKFTDKNRLGMYPSPISVSIANFGWLLFLSWDSKLASSTLYRARLHSPVDKISIIKKNLASTQTLAEVRKEASKFLKRKEEEYASLGHDKHQVNFMDKAIETHIQAIALVDRELVFLADSHSKRIHSAQLKYDGYGVCAINVQRIIGYGDDWNSVVSLCVNNNKLFVSHNQGITLIELASCKSQVVYKSQNALCTVAPFQRGILLTDQEEASLFKIDEEGTVQLFAGTKVEGSQDGPVLECQFKQPIGICVEFDSVVYICDAQSNSLKIITPLSETARFLKSVGKLYDAFSVHKKGQSPPPRTLPEATEKVKECKEILAEYEKSVRSVPECSKMTLNGPQGTVSAVTVRSVDMLHWGLDRMRSLFSALSFDATNLLSCMTLDVEHLHSTSHIKHPLLSKKEYCRDLGNTIKESTKRLSSSTVYYYTSEKSSWYPDPEHEIPLASLPSIPQLPVAKLSEKSVEEMRNYALTYGAAVRQRTNRQETTMARHGTMPEMIYQRQLQISEDRVDLALSEGSESSEVNEEEVETGESDPENVEEVPEYDSSTDEDEEPDDGDSSIPELDRRSTFLLGATTRFGRQVRINSRFLM